MVWSSDCYMAVMANADDIQFHLKCVKLEPPLPEEWWCEECTRLLTAQKKKMKRK